MRNDPGFLGRGWSFPPRFHDGTGAAAMVAAEDDIVESLRILMQTRPGERVMHPTYGCRLHDMVFEPVSSSTERSIEAAISRAIMFFEPRITLHRVVASMTEWLEGRLTIIIEYSVRTTNTRHNMVFPFYRSEGTLLSGAALPLD